MKTEKLTFEHYKKMYALHSRYYPPDRRAASYEDFVRVTAGQVGFVFLEAERMIGFCVFTPAGIDCSMHICVDPEWHGRIFSRSLYRTLFHFPFSVLGVQRISVALKVGEEQNRHHFHKRLGFKHEGTVRRAIKADNDFVDAEIFGLIRSDLKW